METIIARLRKERIARQVQFTLCGECYWCASYLDGHGVEKCPACRSPKVETIPVAGNEMYSFDYDEKRGVIVDFMPAKA